MENMKAIEIKSMSQDERLNQGLDLCQKFEFRYLCDRLNYLSSVYNVIHYVGGKVRHITNTYETPPPRVNSRAIWVTLAPKASGHRLSKRAWPVKK